MSDRHLATFTLSAWALGSLSPEEQSQAEAHLVSCERCRTLKEEMQADRERFTQSVLARTLPAIHEREQARPGSLVSGTWLRWLVPAVGAVALGLVALIAVHPRAPDYSIKGAATFQVFAKRGIEVFAVKDGATLAAGDQLRFAVEPGELGYVLVASLDGAGHASIYYPFDGTESGPVTPGARSELPGSVTLDATAGDERLYALFSADPVPAGMVLEKLMREKPEHLNLPVGSELTLSFHKQAR